MPVKYTDEQTLAINKKNSDILVSAAAGSGKTAVLVERILRLLTEDKTGIDRLLCLTFTEAAATEMREKICDKIIDYTEKFPENEFMAQQIKLLRKSNISTIDAFIGKVVKSHYHLIDIDPNYQIISAEEALQIQLDVSEKLFAEKYAEKNEDFLNLIECFCLKIEDKELVDLVLQVYKFAVSLPYPDKWLNQCVENFRISENEIFNDTVWGRYIIEQLKINLDQINELLNRLDPDFTALIKEYEYFINHLDELYKVLDADIEKAYELVCSFDIDKIKNKKSKKEDIIKILWQNNIFSSAVDVYKKSILNLFKKLPLSNWRDNVNKLYPTVKALVALVQEFSALYEKEKRENRMAEFDDISHYALKILVDENGMPTEVAQSYQQQFDEVIIDEYQDCSFIQDEILAAVSSKWKGNPNRFMVGDIKQCIYKFRKANPEIFAEKYKIFGSDNDDGECLIQLNKNFRSRKNILDTTNFFFHQFMSEDFGEVDYDREIALNYGADYSPDDPEVEFAYINTSKVKDELIKDQSYNTVFDVSNIGSSCEAIYIANKIKQMLNSTDFLIEDTKEKIKRKIEPKDIAILVRKNSAIPIISSVLAAYDIPVSAEQNISVFTSFEVSVITSYLKIIDNPLQDLPLLTILCSPLYSLTPDEFVLIYNRNHQFLYECLKEYANNNKDYLSEKINTFLNDINYFIKLSKSLTPLAELLQEIYKKTGFYNYVGMLSDPEQRQTSLDCLLNAAISYDKINSGNLYMFIDYLEKQANLNNSGNVSLTVESNSVLIMTVHKSKGLEFPVVFVPQLCSKFKVSQNNFSKDKKKTTNDNPNITLNQTLGIGMKLIDPDQRTITNTITNICIENINYNEGLQESLRLLYVAMTRSKEKLYLIGSTQGKAAFDRALSYSSYEKQQLPVGFMQNSMYYADWLFTALCRSNRHKEINREKSDFKYNDFINDYKFNCKVNIYSVDNFTELKPPSGALENKKVTDTDLFSALKNYVSENNNIAEILNWVYPYAHISDLPTKTSISEIKHRYYEEIIENSNFVVEAEPVQNNYKRPVFSLEDKEIDGAARGTIYHTFMQHIDFNLRTYNEIEQYKEKLLEQGILTQKELSVINNKKIYKFLNSEICSRIAASGNVYREAAFTLGLTPYQVYNDEKYKNDKDLIHVDGIIDLYFEENDYIVLLDYKTDYIENGNFKPVMDRYEVQLKLYAEAIERATGKTVKERCLYLFNIDEVKFY